MNWPYLPVEIGTQTWFCNPSTQVFSKRAKVNAEREFYLLWALENDLSGAIIMGMNVPDIDFTSRIGIICIAMIQPDEYFHISTLCLVQKPFFR